MARIVIEYPDELTQLTIDAFWALYGGGAEASAEEKRVFCHHTIKRIVAEQVGKYVQQRDAAAVLRAAEEAGKSIVSLAESRVTITAEAAEAAG